MHGEIGNIPFIHYGQILALKQFNEESYQIINTIRYALCTPQIEFIAQSILTHNIDQIIIDYIFSLLDFIPNNFTPFNKNLLYESIWILVNLASFQSSSQFSPTNILLQKGVNLVVQRCFAFQTDEDIMKIAFQLLGNILGQKNFQLKLHYLRSTYLYAYIHERIMNYWGNSKFAVAVVWALKNAFQIPQGYICKISDWDHIVTRYAKVLQNMLKLPEIQEATDQIMTILIYMTSSRISATFQIYNMIKERYHYASPKNKIKLMRIMGNMISSSQEGVNFALDHPIFFKDMLETLKGHHQGNMNKQAAWILSNIFAGTTEQIDKALENNATFFIDLFQIISFNHNAQTMKQLLWSFSNLMVTSSAKAFQAIHQSNFVPYFCQRYSYFESHNNMQSLNIFVQGLHQYTSKLLSFPHLSLSFQQKAQIGSAILMIRSKQQLLSQAPYSQNQVFQKSIAELTQFYLEGQNIEEMALLIMMKQLNLNQENN